MLMIAHIRRPDVRVSPALIAGTLMLTAWAGIEQTACAQAPSFANVPYAIEHPSQALDVWIPAAPAGPKPVVVWIHGGGWSAGDKSSATGGNKVTDLLNRGFVVVSINYRLSQDAIFPAQIHDCKGAIRFLRARAPQFQIDSRRIGVWGSSAGGHLVALLGTSAGVEDAEGTVGGNILQSSRVNAVADFFGPADFFNVDGWHTECIPVTPEAQLLGACLGAIQDNQNNPTAPWPQKVALAHLAGPVTHASNDDPPFHIAHGTADTTVWPEHSQLLHAALVAQGVDSALRLVPGAGHGLPLSENTAAIEFFDRVLEPLPPCPGDFNRDGTIDFFDYDTFVTAFEVGLPRADFNRDTAIDFFDYDEFVVAFEQGC
ncbi:MAG: alpha/beta hydrolase fold domain-containing protein [Planctomycetota bacterium]